MRHLDRPHGRIAYNLYGARNTGPLVVCVPGMGSIRASFRFLAPALTERGYRVAVMDLRGHGDSDVSFEDYGDEAAGSDIAALITELGGGPALLIGNSMGAAASAWVAAEQPGLVSALVLIGPFLRDPSNAPAQRLLLRLLFLRPWGPAVIRAFMGRLYSGRLPQGHAEHTAALGAALRPRERYRAIVRTFGTSHSRVEARLPEVTAPSLVLMGVADPDWPDPEAEADWIRRRIGAEVLMVPEAGHYPQEQRPDLVNPAVLAFADVNTRG